MAYLGRMTTPAHHPLEPAFTLSDRLRKAREVAGLSQQELADAMEVSARTVGRYETEEVDHPRRIVLRQWALACGVSYDWLVGPLPNRRWDDCDADLRELEARDLGELVGVA